MSTIRDRFATASYGLHEILAMRQRRYLHHGLRPRHGVQSCHQCLRLAQQRARLRRCSKVWGVGRLSVGRRGYNAADSSRVRRFWQWEVTSRRTSTSAGQENRLSRALHRTAAPSGYVYKVSSVRERWHVHHGLRPWNSLQPFDLRLRLALQCT